MKENATPQSATPSEPVTNFEQAFGRLEQILEMMNSQSVGLDDSLKLYEEADKLIISCNRRLNEAERKIEVLMKNRQGELVIGEDQRPTTQPFQTPSAPQNY